MTRSRWNLQQWAPHVSLVTTRAVPMMAHGESTAGGTRPKQAVSQQATECPHSQHHVVRSFRRESAQSDVAAAPLISR